MTSTDDSHRSEEPTTDPLESLAAQGQVVDLRALAESSAQGLQELKEKFSENQPVTAANDVKAGYSFLQDAEREVANSNQSPGGEYPSTDPVRLAHAEAMRIKATSDAVLARIDGVKKLNDVVLDLDRRLSLRPGQLELERKQLENQQAQAEIERQRQLADSVAQRLQYEAQRIQQERGIAAAREAAQRDAWERYERTERARRDHEIRNQAFEAERQAALRHDRARVAAINEHSRRQMAEVRRLQFDRMKPKLKVIAWAAAIAVPVSNLIADQPEYSNLIPFSTINNLSDSITEPLFKGIQRSVFGQGSQAGHSEKSTVVAHSNGRLSLQPRDIGLV